MRSDRNPYFLYKNHKDPKIRVLLNQAPNMTDQEIDACVVKPDLRKAMKFVKQFGHQDKSESVSNLVADKMLMIQTISPPLPTGDIYLYTGPQIVVPIIPRPGALLKQSWQVQNDVFLHVSNKIWINHSWCAPPAELWSDSQKIGSGDLNTYNQILHNHVNQKHAA